MYAITIAFWMSIGLIWEFGGIACYYYESVIKLCYSLFVAKILAYLYLNLDRIIS